MVEMRVGVADVFFGWAVTGRSASAFKAEFSFINLQFDKTSN